MLVRIIGLVLILLVSGCYNAPDFAKPMPWIFKQMPEDAPNNYKKAWRDGCESGMSSMTNTYYKTFYSFKMDENLRKDPVYYKTWKDIYTFCRHYVYGTIRESDQRFTLPNARPIMATNFMGAEGIFEAGPLKFHGPGNSVAMPFGNIGTIGGSGNDTYGMGGEMDFSEDAEINGMGGAGVFNWDFRQYSK